MNTHFKQLGILLIILSIALSCQSCKDDKQEMATVCTPDNTVLVPQDMKDRFFFKEGTYWIYINLQTQEIDSIWVWSSYNDNYPATDLDDSGIKNKCYETFTVNTKSRRYPKLETYNRYGLHPYPKAGKNLADEVFEIWDRTELNDMRAIYRTNMKGSQYENQMGAEITRLDSFLTKSNIVYHNILHLKYSQGLTTQDYLDDMHYAKNIGLVKFHRFTDTSNWELIRCKIIQ